MSEENITIDELASMVQKGFNETAKKADMDAGFKAVNERLDKLESDRIEKLEKRMERLEEALVIK